MLLPKEDLSETVRTWELCDLCHVFWGHSGTAFISPTLALLHLNFIDTSPASSYHRPAQPITELTVEAFHLHHEKLCIGHSLSQGRSSIGLGIVKISTVVLLLPIHGIILQLNVTCPKTGVRVCISHLFSFLDTGSVREWSARADGKCSLSHFVLLCITLKKCTLFAKSLLLETVLCP